MDYSLLPPNNLQEKALIAAAIGLFTQRPVKDELLRVFKYRSQDDFDDRWKKICKTVKERIEALELPQTLKIELFGISKQVGLEILEWAKYYGKYYCESAFFNNMCWTPQGAIDAEKTARKLVNDQSLSILKRYRLACIHCFEDCIPDLWKQLDKKTFNEDKLDKTIMRKHNNSNYRDNSLVTFWSYYIHGRVNEILNNDSESACEYGLKRAIDQGSSVAAKHFWGKLTPEEKGGNLGQRVIIAARKSVTGGSGRDRDPIRFPKNCYTNIFCFLLNQMSDEQQMNLLNNPSVAENILNGLLHFPYQQLFIPIAEHTLHLLSRENRYFLLLRIAKRILHYPQGYRKLLEYTWQQVLHQESQTDIWEAGGVLSELFKIEDCKSIELILGYLSTSEREKLILDEGMEICCNLIAKGKWNTLSNFMKCCLPDKDAALKFKAKERTSWYPASKALQENAPKFQKLMDDFIASFDVELPMQEREERNKRKIDDGHISTKKVKTDLEITKVSSNNLGLGKVC